jgi:transposase
MFVRFANDVLLATQTVEGAFALLRTTRDETWHILQKAVLRGKARKSNDPLPRFGIDEKAFRKGQIHITLIYNLDQSTVKAISDGNYTEVANAAFSQLSQEQLGSVQAIAMDMSAANVKSAKANIPLAEEKFVYDRFHVMKMANEAVDKVRKTEHRELKEDGDNRLTEAKFSGSQERVT